MKIIYVLSLCLVVLLPEVEGQTGLGLRGGSTHSRFWFMPRQGVPQSLAPGMEVGVVSRFMNNSFLGLQVEANLSRQGFLLFPDTTAMHHREFTSIQVPVLTYLQLGKGTLRFSVQGGVFGGYILQSKERVTPPAEARFRGPASYRQQNLLPWQYGVMGAAGPALAFPFGTFHFEVRFVQHLSDVMEADFNRNDFFSSTRLQTISFGMQWVYMIGGEGNK